MKIDELLDMVRVGELIQDGYIKERAHPEHSSLRILGYSEKTQWERMWTHETLSCRGLIYDDGTREVLARPWKKFFNYEEYLQDHLSGVVLDPQAQVQVTDKMDGSLGIFFKNPYTQEWEIATRGSFDSDQARKANAEFVPPIIYAAPTRGRTPNWVPKPGWTYLTEIIFPENRIVLDYGHWSGLSLLGAVHIETGDVVGPEIDPNFPGSRTKTFEAETLMDALSLPPRENAEGIVVRVLTTDTLVKVKQEDYVRLHKIVTGLNDRAVWEHLAARKPIVEMIEVVPDEFHAWVKETAQGFVFQASKIAEEAKHEFGLISRQVGVADRKGFAELAKKTNRPHLLFQLLDGRDLHEAIYKELRPVGVRYMNPAFVNGELS